MKLSEILKDWPEREDYTPTDSSSHNQWFVGFNTALTSFDREIDREALVSSLNEINPSGQGISGESMNDYIADHIISTMPTWLKRIEKNV
jgi:hypothetical protein